MAFAKPNMNSCLEKTNKKVNIPGKFGRPKNKQVHDQAGGSWDSQFDTGEPPQPA